MTRVVFRVVYFVLIIGITIPTIMTVWPHHASKINRLGYYSVCPFAPLSTLIMIGILLLVVGIVYVVQRVIG